MKIKTNGASKSNPNTYCTVMVKDGKTLREPQFRKSYLFSAQIPLYNIICQFEGVLWFNKITAGHQFDMHEIEPQVRIQMAF